MVILKLNFSFAPHLPAHIRAKGEIRAQFTRNGQRTSIARVNETGGLRLRFPNVARGCEAVVINTGGGIAGGDRHVLAFGAGAGAEVTLVTQAAEKVYRAQGVAAEMTVSLKLASGSHLEWLPQETILFDHSALSRKLEVEMAEDAVLTMVETIVFGRLAMGEANISTRLRDSWRVRRGGVLVFAEELAAGGAAQLDRPALGGGARAVATLLYVAPDAETRLEAVRAALAEADCEAGASAWNNMLLVRAASASPEQVRAAIVAVMAILRGRDAPRVWQS